LPGELSILESVWSNRTEFFDPLKADIVWLIEDILLGLRLLSLDLQTIHKIRYKAYKMNQMSFLEAILAAYSMLKKKAWLMI